MSEVVAPLYSPRLLDDLLSSGLEPSDLRCRPLTPTEKTATNTPQGVDGYVIPYFYINGAPLPFYRVRLFDADPKYKQVVNTSNHIYFPPNLHKLLPTARFLLWVEGEKKAAAAVKAGFPAVAVGGVDNWKNRTLVLPKDMKLAHTKEGKIAARVPAGAMVGETVDTVATGMAEVIDYLTRRGIPLIIVYDSDGPTGTKLEVQRAAAVLGYELRFKGLNARQIRQLILPGRTSPSGPVGGGPAQPLKVGLDDFLMDTVNGGADRLRALIESNLQQRAAFPRHPNPKEHVNKKLQRTHLSRQETQSLSLSILSDLDAKGARLRSVHDGSTFFFDYSDKRLTRANFDMRNPFHESPFGVKLYRDYNLSAADSRLLQWLGAQFNGEEPISEVSPERIICCRADTFYVQLNDGQTIKTDINGIRVIDNGLDDVLFESGLVKNGDPAKFSQELGEQKAKPFVNQWYEVLKDARLGATEEDRQRKLLSYLYYLSPWFYKWRGTQLPVEITTGEPGSGKSTLYELRLDIISGVPTLRNAPSDMRDWGASLASSGGLHVTDNVQLMDQSLRQKLSDELCRLITEPSPAIEQRKLYTDNTIVRTPVKCVFALTAVRQPFTNVDIIQRSIITELDKGTDANLVYDSSWKQTKLDMFGAREGWLAHHCLFLQKFLEQARDHWDPRYRAKYRLINVEQMLILAAQVFGDNGSWIPQYLAGDRDRRMGESDWALEAITEWIESVRLQFGEHIYKQYFTAQDIVEWAEGEEDFKQCQILQASRSLGRYLLSHKHVVASTIGLVPTGKYGNKERYQLVDPKSKR